MKIHSPPDKPFCGSGRPMLFQRVISTTRRNPQTTSAAGHQLPIADITESAGHKLFSRNSVPITISTSGPINDARLMPAALPSLHSPRCAPAAAPDPAAQRAGT
jgi:hypothetical protein